MALRHVRQDVPARRWRTRHGGSLCKEDGSWSRVAVCARDGEVDLEIGPDVEHPWLHLATSWV